jgi:nitrite reductase/ring-hydroxylating ferredoxin subunit
MLKLTNGLFNFLYQQGIWLREKVYAMDNICTHRGGPLNEGELKGYNLKRPWHYAVFDVRNGRVSDTTVWATNLNSYPVKVEETNGDILVNPDRGTKV